MNATSLRIICVSEKPLLLNYCPVLNIYMHGTTENAAHKIHHQVCSPARVLITEINARTRYSAAMLKESEHLRSRSGLVEERRKRRRMK